MIVDEEIHNNIKQKMLIQPTVFNNNVKYSALCKLNMATSSMITYTKLIDFNSMSAHLGSFYAKLGNHVHCMFIFTFLCSYFLRGFFFPNTQLYNTKYSYLIDLFNSKIGP